LLASRQQGDQTPLDSVGPAAAATIPAPIFSAPEVLEGNDRAVSLACGGGTAATIHQSFVRAPEIAVGPLGHWHDVTQANGGQVSPAVAQSIDWTDDGLSVQGWLLRPKAMPASGAKMPMITVVHGGPAWANQPRFFGAHGLGARLLGAGYALFLPNPRGSFGQGEVFTRANVKDFGYGDLRDILSGITAAESAAPIDEARLGLTGGSYGGYMTMWAVTHTHRFRAAVAVAGVSDWLSYYGENGIDEWMIPYFGASVYDDPAVYAKSSPINFIKNVRTPTLELAGENDIECPWPQTQEFWHALHDLGVPTESVIYPGEGHGFRDPKHLEDYEHRTLAWFGKYLK
jgi:dipeptidyl aminopeptidase/acylaminoacyl peptidase